jgi:NTP pyrophosphatase (non-canonical NTP hydrolase)
MSTKHLEELLELERIMNRIDTLTQEQLKDPTEDTGTIMFHLLEELGEFSTAVCVEDGSTVKGYKTIDEPSTSEAVDMMNVVMSLFFARGGDMKMFREVSKKKLDKWESKINRLKEPEKKKKKSKKKKKKS